jgi:hypothetical protein
MEEALLTQFQRIYTLLSSNKHESLDEDSLLQLAGEIDTCTDNVRREALFSKNEDLDDVHTEDLKYLFLQYYYAKCFLAVKNMQKRKGNLLIAQSAITDYLQACVDFKLLHEADMKTIKNVKPY